MNERGTHELTTQGGHHVVLHDYITGGEFEELMQAMPMAATDAASITVATALAANHLAWKLLVVSVDGSSENVVDAILALPFTDYTEVKAAVEAMTDSKKK